jgi:hypothetical protein
VQRGRFVAGQPDELPEGAIAVWTRAGGAEGDGAFDDRFGRVHWSIVPAGRVAAPADPTMLCAEASYMRHKHTASRRDSRPGIVTRRPG